MSCWRPRCLVCCGKWWKVRPTRPDAGVPLQQRWLFPGRTPGRPMTTRQLNRLFHETAEAAGIAIRRAHFDVDFTRAFALR